MRVLISLIVLANAGAAAQCTKDVECKGERICVKGECADPPAKESAKPKKGALQTLEGVFLALEEGDYLHWNMRSTAGKQVSFFVLRPEASVTKVVEGPKKFVGKKCRVKWKQSVQNIPEAGGAMDLDEIVSVEWL